MFLGEDFHIALPSLKFEVTFKNNSDRRNDVALMHDGRVTANDRAKLNRYETHLIIEMVREGDEGVYTIKNPDNPNDVKRINLIIRGRQCVLQLAPRARLVCKGYFYPLGDCDCF